MNAPRISLVTATLFATLGAGARAEEWVTVGARAMGMGGAGVAVTRGASSLYWNPAGLAPPRGQKTFWDVAVPVTFSAAATGDILRDVDRVVDRLEEIDLDNLSDKLATPGARLTPEETQQLLKLLTEELPQLEAEGKGLVANASTGILARAGRFGFGTLGLFHGGGVSDVNLDLLAIGNKGLDDLLDVTVDPDSDLTAAERQLAQELFDAGLTEDLGLAQEVVYQAKQAGVDLDDPAVQDSLRRVLDATQGNAGGDPLDSFENTHAFDLRGIALAEFALGYAHPFWEVVSVGVNVKAIYGTTFFEPYSISSLEDPGDLVDDLLDAENREESVDFGVDVGVLVQPLSWLNVGVVGRNLNRPRFEFAGPGDYVLDPQVRAGVGVQPLDWIVIAADVDVLENESEALPGYDSQVLGAGVELGLFDSLFLRTGLSKNLAESSEDVVIHAGLGFGAGPVQIDIAGSIAPDFVAFDDSTDIPERAGLSLFVGVNMPLP